MSKPLLLVRFRLGVVGETRRVCHLVPAPSAETMPETLMALCGVEFGRGEAELLPRFAGMPCEQCLAIAPVEGAPPLSGR